MKSKLLSEPKSFPEDLEGRMNAVLASCNTEIKNILIGCILSDSPQTCSELKSNYDRMVGNAWSPKPSAFFDYCQTLVNIGLVAEELTVSDSWRGFVKGWRFTEAGKRYAKPIALLALNYALEHGTSIFNIFGSTKSSHENSRSPVNRYKLIKELISGEKRLADLAEHMDMDESNVAQHLEILKKAGIVDYESVNLGAGSTGWASYTWEDGKRPENAITWRDNPIQTKAVAQYLFMQKTANAYEINKALGYKDTGNTSSVLSELEKQGLCKGKKQTRAVITSLGKELFDKVIAPGEAILRDTFSDERLRELELSLKSEITPELNKAIKLYETVSDFLNSKDSGKRVEQIKEFIQNYTKENKIGPGKKEINAAIGIRSNHYLVSLVRAGELTKARGTKGVEVRYQLAQGAT